jgi:hypothetical protein
MVDVMEVRPVEGKIMLEEEEEEEVVHESSRDTIQLSPNRSISDMTSARALSISNARSSVVRPSSLIS